MAWGWGRGGAGQNQEDGIAMFHVRDVRAQTRGIATELVATELVRSGQILGLFWGKGQQDLLGGWLKKKKEENG